MPFCPELDMDFDPDGNKEQVAVVMKGQTYKEAGLKLSQFPKIEGPLYDKLCQFPRHKLRDDVRKMAQNIAIAANEKNFKPTVEWLDNFMRRFCISRKKMGLGNSKMIKVKGVKGGTKVGISLPVSALVEESQNTIEEEPFNHTEILNALRIPNDSSVEDSETPLASPSTAFSTAKSKQNGTSTSSVSSSQQSETSESTVPFTTSQHLGLLIEAGIGTADHTDKDTAEGVENPENGIKVEGDDSSDAESVKEIPRERSPEKEIINLDSDSEEDKIKKEVKEKEENGPSNEISECTNNLDNTETTEMEDKESTSERAEEVEEIVEQNVEVEEIADETVEIVNSGNEEDGDENGEEATNKDSKEDEDDDSDSNSNSESESTDDGDVVVKSKSWEDRNFVEYNKEEDSYFEEHETNLKRKLEEKLTNCTACYDQVNHNVKEEIFTHPVLGVLLCKKCAKFYGKGSFKKDAEGYDEYCRWCANGGDLFLCDHCTNGFCKKCVKRNLGRTAERDAIKSKSWECYVCSLKPLIDVRALHRAVLEQIRSISILKKSFSRRENRTFNIKQRFSALKQKRKSQGLDSGSKEDNSEDVLSNQFTRDVNDLCISCMEHLEAITKRKNKSKAGDTEEKARRRLWKLADVMEKNFARVKLSLREVCGDSVDDLVSQDTEANKNEDNDIRRIDLEKSPQKGTHDEDNDIRRNDGEKSPQKDTHERQAENENRKRVRSDSSDNDKEAPAKKIIMETDSEGMEMDNEPTSLHEDSPMEEDIESCLQKSSEDIFPRKSPTDKDNNTSNEGSNELDDEYASSKNPDGESDNENNIVTDNKDNSSDNLASSTKSSSEGVNEEQNKSDVLSVSDGGLSQSLLQDINVENTESEDKESSVSSKKGILYSRSRKNREKEKALSDTEDELDKILGKDKNNSKESSSLKGIASLLASDSSENESKDDKKKKSDEDSEKDETDKKKSKKLKRVTICEKESIIEEIEKPKPKSKKLSSKIKNGMKSLINSDSDSDSDLDNLLNDNKRRKKYKSAKKTSTSTKTKCKQDYKPKPKSVQNALKEAQLNSSEVKIERLKKEVTSCLDEDGFISIDDFPQYCSSDVDLMLDSESDKELDAILNLKSTKVAGQVRDSDNDADSESEDSEDENDSKKKKEKKKNSEEVNKKDKKKKEGLMDINIDKEEEDGEEAEDDGEENGKKKGFDKKNMRALLMSSEDEQEEEEEEEVEDPNDTTSSSALEKLTEEEIEKKKKELYEKNKKKLKEKEKEKESESDNEEITNKMRKKGFFSFKFSSSEEEEDEESEKESPRKARMFVESDSDFETSKKKKKKSDLFSSSENDDDSDESSSDDEGGKKDKKSRSRKRIKRPSSSTEEEDAGEGDGKDEDAETPSKKRRRHIIRDEDLLQSTKDATQEEKERRDRVKDRQVKYNKIFEIDVESDQKDQQKLVLDIDEESKKELVVVHEKLVSYLKPHQITGIRFMWDATIENVERLEKGEKGGGCILAHCMGLGKTLQVIAFIHTLLTSRKSNEKISRVMVCCPVNTVYNWVAEFKGWLKGKLDVFDVVELISSKDLWARAYKLDDWYKEGGVCIIGYDMFRNLSNTNNKRYKGAMRDKFQRCLVDPGPDMMVCDEGHILKNEKTALSIAINKIKTARRIVLTGTPLQNNLKEYHCMIQFVKPNLLGSKKEFMNRFVNPIEAGQCMDAMPREVRRMKRRAHILHNLLEGCVQRFDYSVLKPFLPPKYEYVVSVQMCDVQCKLYEYYLKNLAQGGPKRTGSGLFVDFNNLSRIWSHPVVLYLALRRRELKGEDLDDEEDDLDGFIDDSDTSVDSSDEDRPKKKKKKKNGDDEVKEVTEKKEEENKPEEEKIEEELKIPGLTSEGKVRPDWWRKVLEDIGGENYDEDEFLNRVEISGKLYLLFDILRESCSIGDKVLLFSQSILGLDMIEEFLRMWDAGEITFPPSDVEQDKTMPQPYTHWKADRDYFRLDGSTSADVRKNQCKSFNSATNERCRLFLISTRAGGVGINLVAANRVIIFDSSWNPSHDTQSIFRVYRFGQKKPCYIYRFVAQGTMEEKIYSRQVTKISTSLRVVDEHQIKRYFNMAELSELYQFTPSDIDVRETPTVPEDRLLAELLIRNKNYIVKYHEQDSLLENQTGEELTEEERNAAWEDYENEKKGPVPQTQRYQAGMSIPANVAKFDIEQIYHTILKSNPQASAQQIYGSVNLACQQIQKVHLSQYQNIQGLMYNLKNPMIAPEIMRNMQIQDPNELLQHLDIQLKNLEENIRAEAKVMKQISSVTQSSMITHNNMVAAGLARGNPTTAGAVSSTAQYVTRNIPPTSLVNTSFKKVVIPPKKMSDASTSSAATDPLKITSDKDSTDPAEVVTLE